MGDLQAHASRDTGAPCRGGEGTRVPRCCLLWGEASHRRDSERTVPTAGWRYLAKTMGHANDVPKQHASAFYRPETSDVHSRVRNYEIATVVKNPLAAQSIRSFALRSSRIIRLVTERSARGQSEAIQRSSSTCW